MARRAAVDPMAALCRALDGRGTDPLAAQLDQRSVLHVPGLSGLSGDYQGREAIVGVLSRMATATGGTLSFDVHGTTPCRAGMRLDGWLSGTRDTSLARAMVSVDVMLDGRVYRRVTIECADRAAWDRLWGRSSPPR